MTEGREEGALPGPTQFSDICGKLTELLAARLDVDDADALLSVIADWHKAYEPAYQRLTRLPGGELLHRAGRATCARCRCSRPCAAAA
jgi:hypothetical protein